MNKAITYLQHQRSLLQQEYAFEKETFRRETELRGIGRLVKRGQCWYPVSSGRNYYNSLNQLVIELFRTADQEIEHVFEYGKPVCFFTQDASEQLHYLPFTATVSYVADNQMVVVLPHPEAVTTLTTTDRFGVQLYFDEHTYRLMFDALDKVISAQGNRLAELRDTFHGIRPAHTASPLPVRLPWLNRTQEQAVNEVLRAKDVAIVHGPPGTGKTTTLVEAIYEVLRRESQVLVCAQSNMAVDWICGKLTERGVQVLRIGNPTRVTDYMLEATYERRFEAHPDYSKLWAIRRNIRQLYALPGKQRNDTFHQKIARLRDHANELEIRIRTQLMNEARVIACTLAGAGHHLLTGYRFHTLFIDEAGQALEAACWIALQKADRMILAGDHCQLPPTVKCLEASRGGLERTLMQSLAHNKPQTVSLLTTQYRMHEQLMRFSSDWFYQRRVESAPEVRHRGILDFDTPLTWIDTGLADSHETFIGDSYGRINTAEATQTVETLRHYIISIGKQRLLDERIDIGVISPYKAQVQHLRRLFRTDPFFKPFRELLSVNTVDGFQGQERDIILISLVRANEQGQIGFLSDLRRMNVAITRARMKLFILGDTATLTRHPFYQKLHAYAEALKPYI